MKMPYGKFKGQDIESIPSNYLKWLAENLDESQPRNKQLCAAADKEWMWREQNASHIE